MNGLSEDQISFFNDQGYIIIDDFFPEEDLAAYTRAVRRIVRHEITKAKKAHSDMPDIPEGQEFDLGLACLEEAEHEHVAKIYDSLVCLPEGYRLNSNPNLSPIVNQLMGADPEAPLFATQCYGMLFMPSDQDHLYGWHKDSFYTIPDSRFIQIWAPLIYDSPVDIGTLKVCPGSHKDGWRGQVHTTEGPYAQRYPYQVPEKEVAKYDPIDVPMKLGQLLLFHSGLIHRSGFNSSNRCRFSLIGLYHQIENEKFRPLLLRQVYVGKTPDQYFEELYGTEQ